MIEVTLGSLALHTDDTPVKVRDAWRKLKYTGRFWTYVGDGQHPLMVFDYTTSRKRDGPAEFLKNYRGYLQADAFGGYDGIYAGSNGRIVEAGCCGARADGSSTRAASLTRPAWKPPWPGSATLRGGEGTSPATRDCPVARTVVGGTGGPDRRRTHRSDPGRCWRAFMPGWSPNRPRSCRKVRSRAAMDYTLSNWAALCRYTESGWLDIDNNAAENALRGHLPWPSQLALLWERPWRPGGGDLFQPAGLLQASRPRPVRLSPRRADPPAQPSCPLPGRKIFWPCFPTAGSQPDAR